MWYYLLNIHYYCPLTQAGSVTKDCASRQNRLQSGQATLRKRVSIQQHILPLHEKVSKGFLRIFKCVFDTHILIKAVILFLFLLFLNNTYFLFDIRAILTFSRIIFLQKSICTRSSFTFFSTDLKYVVLEANIFRPMFYRYSLLLSINSGRVCEKGLCFKTQPSAEWPGQAVKIFLNIRLCVGTASKYWLHIVSGRSTIHL